MLIQVYLDDQPKPVAEISPPDKLKLDTSQIADGQHQLRLVTLADDGRVIGERLVPFQVKNGPTIQLHGVRENEVVSGELDLIVNAYGSSIGDEFDIDRIESPTPAPTWAWVLMLVTIAACAGYLSHSLSQPMGSYHLSNQTSSQSADGAITNKQSSEGESDAGQLGQTVYSNNCASCHQANGQGLPGVFPSLVGNPAVVDEDSREHILAVLEGLADKEIDGVMYSTPMPGFKAVLDDEQVAAVVNHERKQWGNDAPTVSVQDVRKLRQETD